MSSEKWSARVTSTSIPDPSSYSRTSLTSPHRIQAQFSHLAETYFKDFDFDLGERELGLALSLDHDLDVYASSMGLTKTAVEATLNDEGESVPG
jgi:Dynein associated protein